MTTPGIDRLKEAELTGLRWSRNCNTAAGVGYLGPTVKRYGPLVEYKGLVAAGLLRIVRDRSRPHQDNGYWITPAGLAKLAEVESAAAAYFDTATAPDPDHAGRGE